MGLISAEIDALYVLWASERASGPLLDEAEAGFLRKRNWSLVDAYDLLAHRLPRHYGRFLFPRGYSGHQLHVLLSDDHAYKNLSSDPSDPLSAPRRLLYADAPADYIVAVMRAAHSPEEADQFLRRYERAAIGSPVDPDDTTDDLMAQMAALASLQPLPDLWCHCRPATP
jgi:hypothetical protein